MRSLQCIGESPTAPLDDIGQHEHVQTAEQEQEEREQRRVGHPERWLPPSPSDEIGYDGRRKGNGQPAVELANSVVPSQFGLLAKHGFALRE